MVKCYSGFARILILLVGVTMWLLVVPNSSGITPRFTQIADKVSKAEARQILRETEHGFSPDQVKKAIKQLGSGRMDSVSIRRMNNGELRLYAERQGAVSGYQRMSFGIDSHGSTNKVVQTAFDDLDVLVRQSSGASKNNLYDVKKWTLPSF